MDGWGALQRDMFITATLKGETKGKGERKKIISSHHNPAVSHFVMLQYVVCLQDISQLMYRTLFK